MTEEKRPNWLNHMAMATIIFAVCATLSTFKGGGYSTQSVVNQTLASDQWAFYQAKRMKQYMFELQVERLELELLTLPTQSPARASYEEKIAGYKKTIARYSSEEKEIEADARKFEEGREQAKRHNKSFGIAVIFLQISILLTSLAGLLKMRWIWLSALPLGAMGIIAFADGFLLFF